MVFRTVNETLAFKNFESRIKECKIPSTGMLNIIDYEKMFLAKKQF